jgi:hypothetical protein
MLLSNRHRFLFVHIAKTGGTSVRSALCRRCWKDPLQIPLYICSRLSHLSGHRIGAKFSRHAPAVVAREMLCPSYFDSLFKFAFVRNPWDRLVSSYHHFVREQRSILIEYHVDSFDDFVSWLVEDTASYRGPKEVLVAALRRPQIEHLLDFHGRTIVDHVGRFEQLHNDFADICRRLDIRPPSLPHKRQAKRNQDYRRYYSDTTAELAGIHFRRDAELLGYGFDGARPDEQNNKLLFPLAGTASPDCSSVGPPENHWKLVG